MRPLAGNSRGDGAGAAPGFSSTPVRVRRVKSEERRRRRTPSKPQQVDGGALGTCGGGVAGPVSPKEEQPWSQLIPIRLGSAEQESGNAIKGCGQG